MFSLERHLSIHRYGRDQRDRVEAQLKHVQSQMMAVCSDPHTLSGEGYVHAYVLGILDAITATYEAETRKRIGIELHRGEFVRFVTASLRRSHREAVGFFERTKALCAGNPHTAGFVDGRADGVAALRFGHKPDLLQRHLAQGHAPANLAA